MCPPQKVCAVLKGSHGQLAKEGQQAAPQPTGRWAWFLHGQAMMEGGGVQNTRLLLEYSKPVLVYSSTWHMSTVAYITAAHVSTWYQVVG